MTDKFVVGTNEIGRIIVTDAETGNVYHHDNLGNFLGLIRLLNEQQEMIEELKTHNLQHFLEWLVIKGYVTDEQMKDINNVIACVNEFNEYIREFEKELLDNGG